MNQDSTTSIIVTFKGTKDTDRERKTIQLRSNANLITVRKLAAEKLGILGSCDDVQLWTKNGELLNDIDTVKNQQVVYIDLKSMIKSIPHGLYLPFVGNLYDLLPDTIEGFIRQFDTHGPLVEVNVLGYKLVSTNDPEYAEIFAKESEYFTKKVTGQDMGLGEFREFAGKGLFTSDTEELDWKLAHKLLMPAFSPRAIKAYQQEMGELTQEAVRIFNQYSPTEPVDILDWTTKITFETIGRIGFGYDFNLLSDRDQPPNELIEAMNYCLRQSAKRVEQLKFMKYLPIEANRKYDRSVKVMHTIVDQVIVERKNGPDAKDMKKDVLGYMLNARDEHGLGLSDENIRDQVLTFLIAGHDTTANTLAWAFYELSRHPGIMEKVLQEIADNHITWDSLPSTEQISNLKYIQQVLKETLRMHPPVNELSKYCQEDCILPGGYKMKAGTSCFIHVFAMHHNEKVYTNPYAFNPDRWTPEEEQKRSRFAWLPFSTGPRGCLGMALALQEAKTVMAMLLNKFDFRYEGPDIQYDPKAATLKPVDLFMTIHPRKNFPEASVESQTFKKVADNAVKADSNRRIPVVLSAPSDVKLPPITFLFGTQTGTAQDYANQLANQAKSFGFKDVSLCDMDKWKVLEEGKFTSEDTSHRTDKELVVICTATYNGQPPDSAEKFNKFLDDASRENDDRLLNGISFSVFGLGNKNWRTYQHFPIKVASKMEELGAERFFPSGEGDVDKDMDFQFNEWSAHFWTYTLGNYGINASESKSVVPSAATGSNSQQSVVKVKFIQSSDEGACKAAANNRNGENNATICTNREIQKEASPRSTRHIEVDISKLSPVGNNSLLYNAGDHVEVFPENSKEDVESVASYFGWDLDSVFEIDQETLAKVSPRSLAANIKGPCTIRNMLTYYADITSPPSRAMLACFDAQLQMTAPETAAAFHSLLMPDIDNQDQYPAFIQKYRTLIDLQKAYPQVSGLDLGQFLASVPVFQPRRYSIASSPLTHPKSAHLTVGVVDDVIDSKHYSGLSSSFLKRGKEGTSIRAALKSCKSTFNMPEDPSIPLILISAGTGISPFRGFLQERKVQREKSDDVGDTVLFFGCRREDHDYIYQEELEEYVKTGVISQLHVAFSRSENKSPIQYVQHALVLNASSVWNLISPSDPHVKPAAIYICGSGAMSRDVRRAFADMAISSGVATNDIEADKFINKLTEERRYFCDVWG